jgi:hypothetical protein
VKKLLVIRLTMLVLGALALALAGTACGGSKKSSSPTNTIVDVTTATTATPTTSSSSSGSTSTTSSGSTSGSSGDLSKSCLDFASAASKLGSALASTGSPTADSESLKTYFEGLAAKAPSDIKASFQTLADAIAKYVDTIKGLNLKSGSQPSAGDVQKLQEAAASLGTSKVKAASDKISAWVKAGCHS